MKPADDLRLQVMPCPSCGREHPRSQHNLHCRCGVVLEIFVPIFFIQAPPYGWRWKETKTNG